MKRTYANLIAEKLYFNVAGNSLCNRNWLFSIYKSLLISNSYGQFTISGKSTIIVEQRKRRQKN